MMVSPTSDTNTSVNIRTYAVGALMGGLEERLAAPAPPALWCRSEQDFAACHLALILLDGILDFVEWILLSNLAF